MNGIDPDEENQDNNQHSKVTSKTSIGGKLLRTTSVPPQVQIMET